MTPAELEELEAALPLPADGYADGGTPYTDQEIAWMRQSAIQDFMDAKAKLNVANRLFC